MLLSVLICLCELLLSLQESGCAEIRKVLEDQHPAANPLNHTHSRGLCKRMKRKTCRMKILLYRGGSEDVRTKREIVVSKRLQNGFFLESGNSFLRACRIIQYHDYVKQGCGVYVLL